MAFSASLLVVVMLGVSRGGFGARLKRNSGCARNMVCKDTAVSTAVLEAADAAVGFSCVDKRP